MAGVRLLSRQLVFGVGRQVEVSLRQKLFDHMLKQDPGWVQTIGTGEVITRATSDLENIRRLEAEEESMFSPVGGAARQGGRVTGLVEG